MSAPIKPSTTLSPRDLVIQTLEFRNTTGRVPRDLWTLPIAHRQYPDELAAIRQEFPADVQGCDGFERVKARESGDPCEPGEYTDAWGCTFVNLQRGYIGEVKRPLVTDDDWADQVRVHVPEEWLSIDPAKINEACAATDRFVMMGACPRPFERLQFIRGTENLFIDLALDNPGLHRFIERMHDFYCRLIEAWAQTDIDAVRFMDDWGAQRSLLIDPALWVRVFKPLYRDYINLAKKYGKKVFMHSDGYTLDIIPHLIDLGLDAINAQVWCIGLDRLRPFRGEITFWGEIDRQHLLPYATAGEIRRAVRDFDKALWHDGGTIAQLEFGAGARPENVYAAFDEWNRLRG